MCPIRSVNPLSRCSRMTRIYWKMCRIFKVKNLSKLSQSSTFASVGFALTGGNCKKIPSNKMEITPHTSKSLHINI